jgi:hypothetical protein
MEDPALEIKYQGIVLLGLLTRPNVGTFDRQKNLSLIGDNVVHHDIIENSTNESADHLHGESDTRGQVTVLSELKVLTQQRTLNT